MIRSGFLVFILVLLVSCNKSNNIKKGQIEKAKLLITDTLVYEFLNDEISIIKKYNHAPILIADNAEFKLDSIDNDSVSIIKNDRLFNKEDLTFIFDQIKKSKKSFYNGKLINDANLISSDTLKKFSSGSKPSDFWELFNRKYGKIGFYSFSVPVFSKNRQIMIIRKSHFCGGLCGGGGLFIYKKEGNKWKLLLKIHEWIS